ncbi:MAG TPA: aldehyde ferredoxin oxidoreductase C-terminal domain-containing protein, partial [Verrucomicrobiae bacterium]|nr:aldehyde ferredoxin oxidoreductase C-terminal domain-containing protein [Verrucomicrobiae bacterium]
AQEYEFSQLAYDHELLYALGSMLGLSSRQDILRLIQLVEQAGLDAMSTGVVLAWATEAQERGLISERDLGCRLKFGAVTGYIEAIKGLVDQRTEGYRVLALGAEGAAKFYGGREFALTLGKNEVAGYHTGYANIVGQALGARHSHLDNAGYSLDQEKEQLSAEKVADRLILEEVERDVLTSLCICLFARKVYDFTVVEKALGAIGIKTDSAQLYELGRRIYLTKRDIKSKWGFRADQVQIPRRFFQTPSLNGMLEQGHVDRIMDKYTERQEMLAKGVFPMPI